MTQFITEKTSVSQELLPGQVLDLPLAVENIGSITIIANSRARLGKFRLELLRVGQAQPLESRNSSILGLVTLLAHNVTAAELKSPAGWVARITNLNDRTLPISLNAAFPGSVEVTEIPIAAIGLVTILNNVLAQTKVTLTAGTDASLVDFPAPIGDVRFTVPNYERRIRIPVLPDVTIVEKVNNLSTNSMTFRIENGGTVGLTATFEQTGVELVGSFDIEMTGMKLDVELELTAEDGQLTYDEVRATFDGEANLVHLPDWLLNRIFHYREQIREGVSNGVKGAFEKETVKAAITTALNQAMTPLVGKGRGIASVRVENGTIFLGTFLAARRLAA